MGKIAFTAEEAEQRVAGGEKIILVRRETEPADIGGMHVSEGILTSTGGMTSPRGRGRPRHGNPLRRRRGGRSSSIRSLVS